MSPPAEPPTDPPADTGPLVKVVHFDHERADAEQPGFGRGEAGFVKLVLGELEPERRFGIGPNAYHALHGHGVVDALNQLPLEGGPLGGGGEAWIRPGAAEDAARIFYDADRRTYGRRWEFRVHRQEVPEPREYRIVIDNRDYQRTLSRLQFLAVTASRNGWAIHLRL